MLGFRSRFSSVVVKLFRTYHIIQSPIYFMILDRVSKRGKIEITIGSSPSSSKQIQLPRSDLVCSAEIDKSNWLGTDTYPDRFGVTMNNNSMSVQRLDYQGFDAYSKNQE